MTSCAFMLVYHVPAAYSSPVSLLLHLFAMTSFAFMLVCVALPVCQTMSGKWAACLPSATYINTGACNA